MSKITAKNIRPVISGVGYHVNRVPRAEEFAQIDQQLSTYGLDITGDAVTGNISVQQDPNHPGFAPSFTGSFTASAAGAVVGTGAAGSLVCTGSVPVYWNVAGNVAAPRTRRVRISMLEATRSVPHVASSIITKGNAPLIDAATGGITTSQIGFTNGIGGNAVITVPLTKPHDGAQFASCKLYYYVPAQPQVPPSLNGSFSLVQVALNTNTATTIGSVTIPNGTTAAGWWNNGQVQSVTISGLSTVINLSNDAYRFHIAEPACNTTTQVPFPVWLGIEVNYQQILDESFSQ